jgi:hypothetical protein
MNTDNEARETNTIIRVIFYKKILRKVYPFEQE